LEQVNLPNSKKNQFIELMKKVSDIICTVLSRDNTLKIEIHDETEFNQNHYVNIK